MKQASLSHKQLLKADKDYKLTAAAGALTYIDNGTAGINRIKKGKAFSYTYKGKVVKDKSTLDRIKKLAIPPAWTDVWIATSENGHIQATGKDALGRKQYRYHSKWHSLREDTKFHRLYEFGKILPLLRKQIQTDLKTKELTEEKVLATAISLMEQTYIRVGNNDYEKKYGSYGLTTLKDRHVTISKDKLQFSFTGKKSIDHSIVLKDKKLAQIIKQCRDIPGKDLFQYYDSEGNRKHIDSGTLNNYIKKISGNGFSAKDFRTWAGTLQALQCFISQGECEGTKEAKKNINEMLETVSSKLGNTKNICRKYYIHPGLIKLYEEEKFFTVLPKINGSKKSTAARFSKEEDCLLKLLKKSFS